MVIILTVIQTNVRQIRTVASSFNEKSMMERGLYTRIWFLESVLTIYGMN
jgi:hypothetical protein